MADPGYSNPFDDETTGDPFQQSGAAAALPVAAPPPRPAARPTSTMYEPPAASASTSAYGRPTMTEEQLRQKEMELARREQMLEYKERKVEEVKTQITKGKPPPNFPKCWPIWYHNINEEIPEQGRNLVKRMFAAWILSIICYCMNSVALLARIIGTQSAGTSGVDFGLSLLYLVIGPFVSFVFWYRPFYYAVRKNRTISYFVFFLNFAFHSGFCLVMCIGIPSTGGGGFINAFATLGPSAGAGVILIISGVFWGLLTLYCCFQLVTAVRYYRNPPKLPAGAEEGEPQNPQAGAQNFSGVATIGGVTVPANIKVSMV